MREVWAKLITTLVCGGIVAVLVWVAVRALDDEDV